MPPSTTRLYAAAIAIVSGVYSLSSAGGAALADAPTMSGSAGALGIGGVVMLVLGVVVLVHGLALLTPASERIRRVSGPLMIAWSVVMLGNQLLLAASPAWGMAGAGMGGSMSPMDTAGWDPGMVAIAVLMLASGLIMSARRTEPM